MSGLLYRLYHDTGMAIMVCKVTRHHAWVNASYREQACTRCPGTFRARRDQ